MSTAATCTYHYDTDINTFKMNVVIRKRTQGSTVAQQSMVFVLRWQKKVFSPREVAFYQSAAPNNSGQTALLEEFRRAQERSVQRGKGPLKGNAVFTIIHGESLLFNLPSPTTSEEPLSFVGEQLLRKKLQNVNSQTNEKEVDGQFIRSRANKDTIPRAIIDDVSDFKTMGIFCAIRKKMADGKIPSSSSTQQNSIGWDGYEIPLCEITAFSDGRLDAKPGFNSVAKPFYKIVTEDGQEFEYSITPAGQENEQDFPQVAAITDVSKQKAPTIPMRNPPPTNPTSTKLYVNGEIVQLSDLEANNMRIEFFTDLPKGWKTPNKKALSPCLTSITNSKTVGYLDHTQKIVTNFNHPFEYAFEATPPAVLRSLGLEKEIKKKPKRKNSKSSDTSDSEREKAEKQLQKMEREELERREKARQDANEAAAKFETKSPTLMFTVRSSDWWGRHRVEGYGYVTIPFPTVSCGITVTVPVWRPVPSIRSEMKSFFIGSSTELEDTCYVKETASRYGFTSEKVGNLTVRFDIIVQQSLWYQQMYVSKRHEMVPEISQGLPGDVGVNVELAIARAKKRIDNIALKRSMKVVKQDNGEKEKTN
eukprot:TRINITY_DN2117_c0_g1_i1.p1 TRINITY_DN2117_c0_g1~~TRINITY_DN2117_c0_g1_i1.p1  ORF type:complete len:591 (-),score=153.25 TRINITY_DN2117_c0_g1_i1:3-1775(-)